MFLGWLFFTITFSVTKRISRKKPRKQSFSPPSVTNSESKRINSSQNRQTNKLLNGKRITIHVQSRKCKRKTIQHKMNVKSKYIT
ncbi:hypothetical protein V6Z11_A06G033600 [Gossypium hirsutum]